mgnify:CR=1 FL=1
MIAITIVVWLGIQLLGPMLGLSGRYALLFDFAALAALFWTMVNIYQMWQVRADEKRDDNTNGR